MNKKQFWERIWIPLKKKKPPETKDLVLIWNPILKEVFTLEAAVALYGANALEEGRGISKDRIFSDWCYLHPPKKRAKIKR